MKTEEEVLEKLTEQKEALADNKRLLETDCSDITKISLLKDNLRRKGFIEIYEWFLESKK